MEYSDFEPTLLHWGDEKESPSTEEELNLPPSSSDGNGTTSNSSNASPSLSTDTNSSEALNNPPPVPNPLQQDPIKTHDQSTTNPSSAMPSESLQAIPREDTMKASKEGPSQSEAASPSTAAINQPSSITAPVSSQLFNHPSILNPHLLLTQGILPWDPSQLVANQVLEALGSSLPNSQPLTNPHEESSSAGAGANVSIAPGDGSAVQVCETNIPAPVPSTTDHAKQSTTTTTTDETVAESTLSYNPTGQSGQFPPWMQAAAAAATVASTDGINSSLIAMPPGPIHPLSSNVIPDANASAPSSTMIIPNSTSSAPMPSTTKETSSKRRKKRKATPPVAGKQDQATNGAPPFYLFDAPCELRHNFLQAQQKYKIEPSAPDSNAYHYNMAVNGIHQQANAQVNPILPTSPKNPCTESSGTTTTTIDGRSVQLLDGRHKNKAKPGNERNEREQQRAQKITELIEKLRLTMVHGGWKREMKSKYQTLSTCAEYVKHLKQINKDKEALVEKAKSDLDALQRSSDFESVTSSLTEEPTAATGKGHQAIVSTSDEDYPETPVTKVSTGNKGNNGTQHNSLDCEEYRRSGKKARSEKDTVNSEESALCTSSGNESGNSKMSSNISDLTDSNKGSSSDGKGSSGSSDGKGSTGSSEGKVSTETNQSSLTNENCTGNENKSSNKSVSSTAVVVSGIESKSFRHGHADVVVKDRSANARRKKAKRRNESTSLDADFVLNYEEVFLTSNIPQCIATPAGRIVSCNTIFRTLTGLTEEDVKRITIFSFVKAEKLSKLFELVSEALRDEKEDSDEKVGDSNKPVTTVTLPCISFPKQVKKLDSLFLHVSFMPDKDPMKRCIHCLFSDTQVTNGEIRCISQELLSTIFSVNNSSSRCYPQSIK